jgi:hypothetical protein
MYLFKQAEKEYFSRKEQQLDAEACEHQLDIEACKHQLINLSGVMTCNLCGLETYPVFVSGMDCWDTAIPRGHDKSSILLQEKYNRFCFIRKRKK